MPKVSIITINYNQTKLTGELIRSLQAQSFQDYELIVVDNASRRSPFPYLKNIEPNIIAIQSNENLGFAGGNNLGIQKSSSAYIFLLNNDAEVVEGTIPQLLSCFERFENVGAVSPRLYYDYPNRENPLVQYVGATAFNPLTGRNQIIGYREKDRKAYDREAHETNYTHGAAMMLPRAVVEQVGIMPEDFFLYYEELDWCEQIKRAGYRIFVDPKAVVFHKESVSVGETSLIKTYYMNRNRVYFMRRNMDGFIFSIFSLYVFLVMLPWQSFKLLRDGKKEHARIFWAAILWNYRSGKEKVPSFA
ncbi:MAG: glycosyltransferase family 2 protein [Bacteroidota bacterium]